MNEAVRPVLDLAAGLSEGDPGEIGARVLDGLTADAAKARADEIDRRLSDVRSGRETPIPWAEARRLILEDDNGDAG